MSRGQESLRNRILEGADGCNNYRDKVHVPLSEGHISRYEFPCRYMGAELLRDSKPHDGCLETQVGVSGKANTQVSVPERMLNDQGCNAYGHLG